jgi:ribonuclease HII
VCHYRFLSALKEVNKVIQVTKRRASIGESIKPRNQAEAKRFVLSQLKKKPHIKWVIGIDEVGRGPVAGPVTMCAFACSVEIFRKGLARHFGKTANQKKTATSFTDSKQMSPTSRAFWNSYIREVATVSKEIYFEIASKSANDIDRRGISFAIRSIILKLLTAYEKKNIHYGNTFVVLDGSLKAPQEYSQVTVIKGDAHLEPISLASILAKEHRDSYMKRIAKKFPQYGFERHVGYGTKEHMRAIVKTGLLTLHRKTFLKGSVRARGK